MFTKHQLPVTCAALSAAGLAASVTGAAFALDSNLVATDGLAHKVTVTNLTNNSHAGKTLAIVGLGANSEAITETLTAPAGNGTVTSVNFYRAITSITPSATIGADTFSIGWTAAGRSKWLDVLRAPASVAVYASGTINYDLQHSYADNIADANSYPFNGEAAKTASVDHAYTSPISKVRVNVNSHTSGVFNLNVIF